MRMTAVEICNKYDLLFGDHRQDDTMLRRAQGRMLDTNGNSLSLYGDRVYAMVCSTVNLDTISLTNYIGSKYHVMLFASVSTFKVGDLAVLHRPKVNGPGIEHFTETITRLSPLQIQNGARNLEWEHVSLLKNDNCSYVNIYDFWQPLVNLFSDGAASLIIEMIFDFNDIEEIHGLGRDLDFWTVNRHYNEEIPESNSNKILPFGLMKKGLTAVHLTVDDDDGAPKTQWHFDGGKVSYIHPTFLSTAFRDIQKKQRLCLECRTPQDSENGWSLLDSFLCGECGCRQSCVYSDINCEANQIDIGAFHRDLQRNELISYMQSVESRDHSLRETMNSFTLPIMGEKHFKLILEPIPGYDDRRVNLEEFLKESNERRMQQEQIDNDAFSAPETN